MIALADQGLFEARHFPLRPPMASRDASPASLLPACANREMLPQAPGPHGEAAFPSFAKAPGSGPRACSSRLEAVHA